MFPSVLFFGQSVCERYDCVWCSMCLKLYAFVFFFLKKTRCIKTTVAGKLAISGVHCITSDYSLSSEKAEQLFGEKKMECKKAYISSF